MWCTHGGEVPETHAGKALFEYMHILFRILSAHKEFMRPDVAKFLEETRRAREIAKREEEDDKQLQEGVKNGLTDLASGTTGSSKVNGEDSENHCQTDPKNAKEKHNKKSSDHGKHCWRCKISDKDTELIVCHGSYKVRCTLNSMIQWISSYFSQSFIFSTWWSNCMTTDQFA